MSNDKQERISIRASLAQKSLLKKAAELRHMSVSEFMLYNSLDAASVQLDRVHRWELGQAQMQALEAALNEPPEDIPALRNLFSRPSVFEQSKSAVAR